MEGGREGKEGLAEKEGILMKIFYRKERNLLARIILIQTIM